MIKFDWIIIATVIHVSGTFVGTNEIVVKVEASTVVADAVNVVGRVDGVDGSIVNNSCVYPSQVIPNSFSIPSPAPHLT